MKKVILRILVFLLTAGWMLMIFGFSAQSGEASGGMSAIIAEPLTKLLSSHLDPMSEAQRQVLYQQVDGAVRIAAHFTEYAILGGLLMLDFQYIRRRGFWLPWLAGTLYALTDEWHQSFSPGRACDMMDVFIDACGVLFGIFVCKLIIQRRREKHVYHS